MAQRSHTEGCRPGDTLVVVRKSLPSPPAPTPPCTAVLTTNPPPQTDEFVARSPDELSLRRGDRIELIERDDDFGDGWFLGKNTETGENGLFPEGASCSPPCPHKRA